MQYRFSGLDTYRQCPTKYRKKYVENIEVPLTFIYLINGTLFHSAMEDYYRNGTNKITAGLKAWQNWLETQFDDCTAFDILSDYKTLWDCQRSLLVPFRDGTIKDPKSGENYKKPTATAAFRSIKAKSNYDSYKRVADNWQPLVRSIYFRPQDSLSDSFCECLDWLDDYQHPPEYGELIDAEKKFYVQDPWGNVHEGCMDLVLKMGTGYAIHDFKTSKTPKPSVLLDPQLNAYARAGKEIYGEYPQQVSLHFVRTGLVVRAKIDPVQVERVFEEFAEPLIKSIEFSKQHNVWIKHNPFAFQSPCTLCEYYLSGNCNKEYKTDEV